MAAKVKWDRGAWWVVTHHDGQRRKKRVGSTAKKKSEAEAIARKINAAIALGTFAPEREERKPLPCDKELRRWLTTYSPTLKRSYEALTSGLIENHLVPYFGSKDLREIREADLMDFVRRKVDEGLAPKTVRNALSVLRRVMYLAQRDGRIERNPAARIGELLRRVDRRHATEASTVDSWSRKEVATLLGVAREHEPRFYLPLLFLLSTGCRRGEALALKWGDIDFERGRVHLRRALVKGEITSPKSGKGRSVSLAPGLAEALFDAIAERRTEALALGWPELPEWVFPAKTGGPIDQDNFERTWRRVRRRAQKQGVRPLKLHCARHTWASMALASGKSVRWVADQLGHADPAITLRVYAHVIPEEEADLSFADFGSGPAAPEDGPGRHYTAPDLSTASEEDEADSLSGPDRLAFLARPARLERATFRSAT